MLERKKKICRGCGELSFLWARKMCKACDYKENPPKSDIKRTAIKYKKRETGELEFMKMVWEASAHNCEECGVYLPEFSPAFISHILSKGAAGEHRLNPVNVNILCYAHHQQWEFGDKKSMKIFPKNMKTIMELKRSASERTKSDIHYSPIDENE